MAGYLSAQQNLGRIRPGVDVHAAAARVLGASFQRAFLGYFAEPVDGDDAEDSDRRFVTSLVDTLATGLLADHPAAGMNEI